MKTWLIAVAAIVGGLVLGVGGTLVEHGLGRGQLHWQDLGSTGDLRAPQLAPSEGPQPVAKVDQEEFDFGSMQRNAARSHTFRITNTGNHPLELRKGSTSCKCTLTKFDTHPVEPGETRDVVLDWTARSLGSNFREVATILTNDPHRRRIDLVIKGRLTETLRLEPGEILFGRLLDGEEKTADVRLLCFRSDNLTVTDTKLVDEDAAKHLAVVVTPIPADQLDDPDAKSGMTLSVTVKPGLPIGLFRAELEVKTNIEDQDTLKIPIEGHVASDISIVGRGWSSGRGILTLGTVKSRDGVKRKLTIFVRGENPEGIELELAKQSPDLFQVQIGEKTKIAGRPVVKIPLVIEIPPGVGPISRLGTQQADLGEILIATNHPGAPQLRLLVRFAVE
jgi:hypothetical protein